MARRMASDTVMCSSAAWSSRSRERGRGVPTRPRTLRPIRGRPPVGGAGSPRRRSPVGHVRDELYGPERVDEVRLQEFTRRVFSEYGEPPISAPIELARDLVFGAADYARALGFDPHPDFEPAREHLGAWSGPSAITFGCNGKPDLRPGPLRQAQTCGPHVAARGRASRLRLHARGRPLAAAHDGLKATPSSGETFTLALLSSRSALAPLATEATGRPPVGLEI